LRRVLGPKERGEKSIKRQQSRRGQSKPGAAIKKKKHEPRLSATGGVSGSPREKTPGQVFKWQNRRGRLARRRRGKGELTTKEIGSFGLPRYIPRAESAGKK